jgi:hypothetical protein
MKKVTLDSSNEFESVLIELKDMHDRKSKDYGSPEDSWANVLASTEFGVQGWVGALIRMNDKLHRIKNHVRYGTPMTNESVEDSLIDMPVYNIAAIICYRREQDGPDWYKK